MSTKFEQQILAAALEYAARGWPVIPLIRNSKVPAVPHGSKDASTDPGQVKKWFGGAVLEANLGICTGTPGPSVLDVDTKETRLPSGAVMTAEKVIHYLSKAGLLSGAIGAVRTQSGGRHYFYRGDDQPNAARICGLPLDARGVGGYVCAPPSRINDKSYEWLDLESRGTSDEIRAGLPIRQIRKLFEQSVPEAVRNNARKASAFSPGTGGLAAFVLRAETGQRHPSAFWALMRCAETDGDPQEIIDAAIEIGIPEKDLERAWAYAQRAAGV